MRTEAALTLTKAGLSMLVLTAMIGPALALNCTTKSGTCYDTKTKEYRNCTTKVCLDDKGAVVSTETVLELQGGGKHPKPKIRLPETSGAGAASKQ